MNQSNAAPASAESYCPHLIFIVDDEPMLVEFAASILQSAGCSVQSFTDPALLLKALGESAPKPSLLVTDYDLGLHAMNGLELIVNCHKIHPSLKTVLASGTVDGSVTLHHPAKVDRFLSKPYPPAQLRAIVAELLK
jgi:DNA-binding NtrC family response regulator